MREAERDSYSQMKSVSKKKGRGQLECEALKSLKAMLQNKRHAPHCAIPPTATHTHKCPLTHRPEVNLTVSRKVFNHSKWSLAPFSRPSFPPHVHANESALLLSIPPSFHVFSYPISILFFLMWGILMSIIVSFVSLNVFPFSSSLRQSVYHFLHSSQPSSNQECLFILFCLSPTSYLPRNEKLPFPLASISPLWRDRM